MKKCLAAFAFALLAAPPAHADIMWAQAGPRTGSVADWGTSEAAGGKQAVADINAAGGINGQKIVLKDYDDVCDPKQAVAIANKIVSENIHFVIHATCSAATLAMLQTYIDEGTLVINPFASNPAVTDNGGPDMFRAIYRDDNAGKVLADELAKHFADKRLVILNDKSAYGLGIAQYVQNDLHKAGVHEIAFESYDPGNQDYSVLVTRLKSLDAQVVFIGGYPVEAGLITRQLREAGSKAQVIGGDISAYDFWKIAGAEGEGTLFVFPSDPRKEAAAKPVIAELEKAGVPVEGYTLYGYAAAQVLAQAISDAKSDDPAKVAAIIHKETFTTILGPWSFDAKGDVENIRLAIFRWHNGAFEEVKQ
jgi:branched-chain amino acid transport system substrate-binding protein